MDFAKDFDSVVWDAMDMVLQHFGFGQNVCRWIKVLFSGTLASLMFNGRSLAIFELGAVVRQGDPLSPALIVLFIEPILNFLRVKMQGLCLQCGYSSHSVISFADDCTGLCMTSGTLKSFSDMSTNIVWLQACDLIRPRLWCCHFGRGQRLSSLYDCNWNNWVSML